eukprot:4352425-Karenia_brevis.AAC.1
MSGNDGSILVMVMMTGDGNWFFSGAVCSRSDDGGEEQMIRMMMTMITMRTMRMMVMMMMTMITMRMMMMM